MLGLSSLRTTCSYFILDSLNLRQPVALRWLTVPHSSVAPPHRGRKRTAARGGGLHLEPRGIPGCCSVLVSCGLGALLMAKLVVLRYFGRERVGAGKTGRFEQLSTKQRMR